MTTRAFKGFQEVWTEFWELDEQDLRDCLGLDISDAPEHFGDFWDQPVALLDDGDNEFLMDGHTGKDVTHSECHGFKCLDLVAEGAISRLFLYKDLNNLVERSAGAAYLDEFVQG